MFIGLELEISSFGEYIQTYDAFEDEFQLHPNILYSPKEGTAETGYFPNLSARYTQLVGQPDDSQQLRSTDGVYEYTNIARGTVITTKLYYKIGDTSTTSAIRLESFRNGEAMRVEPFYSYTYLAGIFDETEGTILELDIIPPQQGVLGEEFTIRFTSLDGSDFSLLGLPDDPWVAADGYALFKDPIITERCIDKILTDENGEILVDDDGNLMTMSVTV